MDPLEDLSNPNWTILTEMFREESNKKDACVTKEYTCKKCKVKFTSPRYNGKYPLCPNHRLKA